jgi:hypothetical protein
MTFDSSQGFVPGQLSGPMIFWDSAGGQPAGVFTTATLPIAYSFSMTDTPPGGGQAHAIGAICLWRKRRERTSFGG